MISGPRIAVIPAKPVWLSSLGQVNGQSARLMWPPGWKVFGGYYEAKEILDEIAQDGDIVAARQNIEFSSTSTNDVAFEIFPSFTKAFDEHKVNMWEKFYKMYLCLITVFRKENCCVGCKFIVRGSGVTEDINPNPSQDSRVIYSNRIPYIDKLSQIFLNDWL